MVWLSVVTVCMNRQEHLFQTAPKVHAWANRLGVAWEHLVLDWSSRVPVELSRLPSSESLRLIRVEGESVWHLTRACNFAIRQSRGELLFKVDADCWPMLSLDLDILRGLGLQDVLQGAVAGGSEGSWLMHRHQFDAVGGFHELVKGYGCDDIDLRGRLQANGCLVQTLPSEAIGVIRHGTQMRVGRQKVGAGLCQPSAARALKDALAERNRWVVACYPWSKMRDKTLYIRSGEHVWQACRDTIPQPNKHLELEIANLMRERFWAGYLALSPSLLARMPRSWFGDFDGHAFEVKPWHQLYWQTGRRLMLVLRQVLISCCRALGG